MTEIEANCADKNSGAVALNPIKSIAGSGNRVFNDLRRIAYCEVLQFRRCNSIVLFRKRCLELAIELNEESLIDLSHKEIRRTAKAVADWTWEHFSEEKCSEIRRTRARYAVGKRWEGHIPASREWKRLGISKATYYRRKRKGTL